MSVKEKGVDPLTRSANIVVVFENPVAAGIVPGFGTGAMDTAHAPHPPARQQQPWDQQPFKAHAHRHGSVGSVDSVAWNHPSHAPPHYMSPLRSTSYAAADYVEHPPSLSHAHVRQANLGARPVPPPGPPPPPQLPYGIYEEPSPPYTIVSSNYSSVDQSDRGQPPTKRQRVEGARTNCQANAIGTVLETAELQTEVGPATRAAGVEAYLGIGGGGGGAGGSSLWVPVAAVAAPQNLAPPAAVPRTAAKPKRVRTGCLTCRERHLKCDEGTPDCLNCRKSNRACKRGIRLNFIDVQVRDPPYMLPASEGWTVQFQDESRLIASEYQGGLGQYATFNTNALTPPREADLDVVLRGHLKQHQQPRSRYGKEPCPGGFLAVFDGNNVARDTQVVQTQQGDAGDTPPGIGTPSRSLSGPSRELESLHVTARPGPGGLDSVSSEVRLHEPRRSSGRVSGDSAALACRSDLLLPVSASPPSPPPPPPPPVSWKDLGLESGTGGNGRGGKGDDLDLPSDVSSAASSWVPEAAGPTAHCNTQLPQPIPATASGALHLQLCRPGSSSRRQAQEQHKTTPPQVETPDGLAVTPLSERSTASNDREREFLSSSDEMRYMQAFVQEVAVWMDSFDGEQHFGRIVPFMALRSPMLLNASLACGVKHLSLVVDAQRGGGNSEDVSCRTASASQNSCIHHHHHHHLPQHDHDGALPSVSSTLAQTVAPAADEGDRDKALYYYDTATTQLMLALKNPDRSMAEAAAAAVVLNVYEIMCDTSAVRMNHLAGARALIRECGWTARSTGIGAACFWLNIRMEVLRCLAYGWETAWNPDQWGLDPEFTTWGMEGGGALGKRSRCTTKQKQTRQGEGNLGSGSCSRGGGRGGRERRHDEALYDNGERNDSRIGDHMFHSDRRTGGGGGGGDGSNSNGSELGGIWISGLEAEETSAGSSSGSGSEGILASGEREDVWVHRIFYIVAKIGNFRAGAPIGRVPSPHDEQARLQTRFGEWRRLKGMCDAWNSHCPRPMRPFGYCHDGSSGGDAAGGGHAGALQPPTAAAAIAAMIGSRLSVPSSLSLSPPSCSPLDQTKTLCDGAASGRRSSRKPGASVFPNVWLISRAATVARLLYHTAMCLLAQVNPLNPRDSDESRAAQLHHARQVCGIVAHSADRGVVSVAVGGLAIAAAVLYNRGEQGEVLDVLGRLSRETGWRVDKVGAELKRAWGWTGGSGRSGGGGGGGGEGGRTLVNTIPGPVSGPYGGEQRKRTEGVRASLDGRGSSRSPAGWGLSSPSVTTQAPCSGVAQNQHQLPPGLNSSVGDTARQSFSFQHQHQHQAAPGSIAPPPMSAAPTCPMAHPLLGQADFSLPNHPYQNFYEPPNRTGTLSL